MPVVEAVNEISEYEKLRARNIEENKKMLESLGLLRAFKPILQPIKKKVRTPKVNPPVKRKYEETKVSAPEPVEDSDGNPVRRSLRVKKKPALYSALPSDEEDDYDDDSEAEDEDEWKEERRIKRRELKRQSRIIRKPKVKRDNTFGAIEGVPVGMHWDSRIECSDDGVHRPTVAGIHGNEAHGCFSLALSGGYEDDLDLGDSFTYTGSGGRDLKGTVDKPKNLRTAPQSSDQRLEKGNLALSLNVKSRKPVRVIRGFKCPSAFAPEYGYRYDGLYTVEKCWSAVGMSGFLVWKFVLKRVADQAPPPWTESLAGIKEVKEEETGKSEEEETDEETDGGTVGNGSVNKDESSDEGKDDGERVVKRQKGDA